MSRRRSCDGLALAGLLVLMVVTGLLPAKPANEPQSAPSVAEQAVESPAVASASTGVGSSSQPILPTGTVQASAESFRQMLEQLTQAQIQQSDQLDRTQLALEKQIEGLRPNLWDKWLTALVGLAGAFFGATVAAYSAYRLQKQRQQFEQAASRQTAGISELGQIKQFRSRQLNEFYGPLQALLQQGLVVRHELYRRMRNVPVPGVLFSDLPPRPGSQRTSLGNQHNNQEAVPFRLIDELPFLRGAYPQLMSNVGEMVRINSLVVALIHDKVGLVLHENTKLSQKLGIFLAHQSVLQEVYTSVKGNQGSVVPALGYSTTFPRGLQELVDVDCGKLRKELQEWEERVTRWSHGRAEQPA